VRSDAYGCPIVEKPTQKRRHSRTNNRTSLPAAPQIPTASAVSPPVALLRMAQRLRRNDLNLAKVVGVVVME
jgi:hypothetical protein